MDDTADKVRRNVVTFSAAIIGMSFLQLKVERFGLLGIELSGISPLRIWIVLFVVILYLFLRYHFDENTANEWATAKKSFLLAREPRVMGILSNDAREMLTNGTSLRYLTTEQWIADDFSAVKKHVVGPFNSIDVHTTSRSNFASMSGETQLTAIFQKGEAGEEWQALHRGSQYKLPKARWLLLTAQTALSQLIYSRSSVNVFVPYILAAIAAIISMCKIIKGLLLSI